MSVVALGWAMETGKARTPMERLILIEIGNGADAFGFAMTDRARLRALAAASRDELEEAMTGLVERRVSALVPGLGKLDRAEVGAPGYAHPLFGEVTLP
jgi:hypothetical protein